MYQAKAWELKSLGVEAIATPDNWRDLNRSAIQGLMTSIREIGLQIPITVRLNQEDGVLPSSKFVLVAGRHRLEACRQLGMDQILCRVIDHGPSAEREARLWYISENLHRAELTTLDKKMMVAEWIRLTEDKLSANKPAQHARVSKGGRGHKGGLSAAVLDLGITRREGQRALTIARITPEAESVIRTSGLADNQNKLLEIGAASPDQQVMVANALAMKPTPQTEFNARAKWFADMNILWNKAHPKWKDEFARANPAIFEQGGPSE